MRGWTKLAGIVLASAIVALHPGRGMAQVATEAPLPVANAPAPRIEAIKIHSREIAGNLLGTSAEREVYVVLPPSYDRQPKRRYPVVYALHGYSIDAAQWLKEIHVPDTVAAAFAKGTPEMIMVFPNSKNEYGGAFYSNSVTTGNFENFIADELIEYIDAHYRTIARPEARGLVGHSMGGYGAARIGILRAERFGALYLMSPCCLSALGTQGLTGNDAARIGALTSIAAAKDLPFKFAGPLAISAAFAPNPHNPPLFVDLPVDDQGKERPDIIAKRAANAPLDFLDQYIAKVRRYRAIGMDVGDQDTLVGDTTRMHEALDAYGIGNRFEVYSGTHTSRVAFRFQDNVLPFFGRALSFVQPRR
ncbi:alpha/beta hydrolase [Sphingomonas sp. MMS24-J13]|uniref:alpha/beta hydrolase n=1 Tax=Sphingomonas sp. MMS24-J13 TaxID=3238686 RepID=UPI00384A9C48